MTIHIDVIDKSTGSKYDWEKIAHAVQWQIRLQVAPRWGIGNAATVRMAEEPLPGHWPVYILDNTDYEGALGYHTTADDNPILPIGKVFVKTDEAYGLEPSVTFSHECVEIIGDPMGQYAFQATATQFWALELCDACEADSLGYLYDDVLLSDFVLPQWFYGGPGPYTYRNSIPTWRTLARGGYQAYFDTKTGSWTQVTGRMDPGQVSRALTMGVRGRVEQKMELQEWAEAVPQQELRSL